MIITADTGLDAKQLGLHVAEAFQTFLEKSLVELTQVDSHELPQYVLYHVGELIRIKRLYNPASRSGSLSLLAFIIL